MCAPDLLSELAAGGRIAAPVMIVVAHPDDETIGMGAQLCRFDDALLVHVTDGAPRDGKDARTYGFATPAHYAQRRRRELAAALQAGDVRGVDCIEFGIADQEAIRDLKGVTSRLATLFREHRPAAVFTHAYEGGHPDHDAAAFAAHAAGNVLTPRPSLLEMPLYHRLQEIFITQQFLPLPSSRCEVKLRLSAEDRARKGKMIECFATQRSVLTQFDIEIERFRPAPPYDFTAPPHDGILNYESWGMSVTGAEWRRLAASAMTELGLNPR